MAFSWISLLWIPLLVLLDFGALSSGQGRPRKKKNFMFLRSERRGEGTTLQEALLDDGLLRGAFRDLLRRFYGGAPDISRTVLLRAPLQNAENRDPKIRNRHALENFRNSGFLWNFHRKPRSGEFQKIHFGDPILVL